MNIILDIAVVVFILFFAFFSAKKGFVRIFIEVVGLIVATTIAFSISTPLANTTYDKFIEPALIESLDKELGDLSDVNSEISAEETILKGLPKFLKNSIEYFGFSFTELSETLSQNIKNGTNSAALAISKDVIKPAAVNVLSLLYSAILILILSFLVRVIAKAINKLVSLTFADKFNRFLGGLLGFFKGILLAILICNLIYLVVSFTNNGFFIFTPENIENTYIFKYFIGLTKIYIL